VAKKKFEVVFETAVYKTVVVEAEDIEEAQDIAVDNHFPDLIPTPYGYELDDNWFVEGVTRVRDDE